MNTAAQQATASSEAPGSSAKPTAKPPQPDGRTQQEPPVQGQADARQPEQSQHFDNNAKK